MPIETFFWKDFAGGWSPNDDAIKGQGNKLLKMTNVELDRNGALSLQNGTNVLQTLAASPSHVVATDLYSRFLLGTRHDYTALGSGQVFRDGTQLTASGATDRTGFGTAFDYTLITSKNYRVKDTGSGTPANLGIGAPTVKPTLTTLIYKSPASWIATATDVNTLFGTAKHITAVGGHDFLDQWQTKQSVITVNGQPLQTFNFGTYDSANTTDTTTLTQTNFGSTTTPQDPNDVFKLSLFSIDGAGLPSAAGTSLGGFYSMSITIYLKRPVATTMTGGTVMTVPSDYFIYSLQAGVPANGDDIRVVSSNQIVLAIRRQQFQRVGSDSTLDWNTVVGYQLIVNTLQPSGLSGVSLPLSFQGGRAGMVSGTNGINVQYAQMNVAVTPAYVAKSTLGPVSSVVAVANVGYAILAQTPTDPQVTEVWIFRQDNGLDQWYRVLVIPIASIGTAQIDTFNDSDALTLDITVNLNLVSTASVGIAAEIFTIIGPVNGRWYYVAVPFLYPSDIEDPDLTDVSLGVRICGEGSEVYLWAIMVNESLLLIGTSIDVYILSGTFITLPDGTIDLYYRPLGCKFPPITKDAVILGGLIYYMSNSGWASISPNGQNNLLTYPTHDLLYQGEDRYGYTSVDLVGKSA